MTFAVALLVAASFWGHTPPCGTPTQVISTEVDSVMWVYMGQCNIYEAPPKMLDPYEYCRTVVHEYGHLLGLPHPVPSQRGNIMNGDSRELWPNVPGCRPPRKGVLRSGSISLRRTKKHVLKGA
jgi:hypothetical protein